MQNGTYNRGGWIALVFSIIVAAGLFIYIVFMRPGAGTHEIQASAPAAESVPAAAPEAAKEAEPEKPWVDSPEMVVRGAKVYATNCQVCHGAKGLGDGPGGLGLKPPPRNFVEGKWKNGGDSGSLFKTVATGIPGSSMSSFAHLPALDRWAVVQFIRSITHNAVKDDSAKIEAIAKSVK